MQQSALLQIRNLSIHFSTELGDVDAIKNVSLQVMKGEVLAIVGESGSGKSVTSLAILQLLPTAVTRYMAGEILFTPDGEVTTDLLKVDPSGMTEIRGNKIAMIFQEPMTSLNPVLTCGEQVEEAIVKHKKISRTIAKQQVLDLFVRVKLPQPASIYKRYPHQLSGGQKQRVMIAMAISCSPALLIADEPTTALDVTVQKAMLQLIKQLQQDMDMGVIFISHDLAVVREIADHIAVMYKGEVVEQGSVNEVFLNARHPYTKALLACRPALHSKGERLPVVSDFMPSSDTLFNASKQKVINPVSSVGRSVSTATLPVPIDPLISVRNLKVYFPANKTITGKVLDYTRAVDEVSFDIFAGETLGLVGESGCGKTTLGRTLLRLIAPDEGSIVFKGRELTDYTAAEMRRVRKDMQLIFQDPYSSLNPTLTIGEAIMEPLAVHNLLPGARARKEKVIELLEKVNLLPDYFHRYPHEFSGGQRQRVVIARALILNPSFIICDESVSALDVSVQAQVLNLLNDLKQEFRFTSVFISHDLSVVRYVSDRILVMKKGKIVEIGPSDELYNNPKTAYTQELIRAIPKLSW